MALKLLYRKIKEGTWTWPQDIKITLQCFEFLCQTMQQHPFFASNESQQIPLDIVFDQEPTEGLKFENGKIFVNTKDPTLYQRLHQAAVENFIKQNGENLAKGLDNILEEQR